MILLIGCMTALAAACSSPAVEGPVGSSPGPAPTRTGDTDTSSRGDSETSSRGTAGSPGEITGTTAPGEDAASTSLPSPRCTDGDPLIEGATWIDVDGRPSLEVTPTALLRRCSTADVDEIAWGEVTALAPDADSPGMAAQLTCHILFAPAKEVWHLEPWRPVVDTVELVRSRCNPGGADPDLP